MAHTHVDDFARIMAQVAPYMSGSIPRMLDRFGPNWETRFGETLARLYPDGGEALEKAVRGYVRFALDATRLQKRFEKELRYIAKTYEEAANAVYQNREYMHELYLPGILLSHYLWPHHYRQLEWFLEHYIPLVEAAQDQRFYDIGMGTGYYSRIMLTQAPGCQGLAVDVSAFSIAFSTKHIEAFGLAERWSWIKRDILRKPLGETRPFLLNVEVLEHLEDPVAFLKGLRGLLAPGGYGFITAAINAPNEDHIYLYRDCGEVMAQLEEAGFQVVNHLDERAYEPKADEPVPSLGAFIVK